VPDFPQPHLVLTVRTDQGITTGALPIPFSIALRGDDLDGTVDHTLDLRQGRLNHRLDLGKRLGGLHPVVANPFEPFGKGMLNHPANKGEDVDGLLLHALTLM